METPIDKAIQLADKYYNEMNPNQPDCNISYSQAIECAKIAVEEIIKLLPNINNIPPKYRESEDRYFQYWYWVKNELNKL